MNKKVMSKAEIIERYGMTQEDWNEVIERYKWHLEYDGYNVTKNPIEPKMKIVQTDNYGREDRAEFLVAEVSNKYYGEEIVELLNNNKRRNPEHWFVLKEHDYKLWGGMAECV